MVNTIPISNDRQAKEAEATVAEIDQALSSEQSLRALVAGFPREVIEGLQRSLKTERSELAARISSYRAAKDGNFAQIRAQAGNDPGSFLIAMRIIRGFSQKELARKLGLKEQAIQRWESDKYRAISLANYQKIARALGVRWKMEEEPSGWEQWNPSYDVDRDDLVKVLRHARKHGWLDRGERSEQTYDLSDETAISTLVRYVGDHVIRYGTPSLLRTGMQKNARPDNWALLSWKAQVTRQAEQLINQRKPRFRPTQVSWLLELVQLSELEDGPRRAKDLLLEHGILLVAEPQIPGMSLDGATFLADDFPVIGMTLLRDTLDNFWFTLMHEVGHIILHYRTGLSSGFFDDFSSEEFDEFEEEANSFASNLLIPEEAWVRSPARISKSAAPIERFAAQLKIHPAIVFGRIRKERNRYDIFSDRIGRGVARKQLFS